MRNTARQTRENRTITVDFQDETTYDRLLDDGKAFVEFVLAFLLALSFQLAHKATCRGGGCLTRHSHYRPKGGEAALRGNVASGKHPQPRFLTEQKSDSVFRTLFLTVRLFLLEFYEFIIYCIFLC